MRKCSGCAALVVVVGLCLGIPYAGADIYTWTDSSGRVNVSNLAPPAGARVVNVVHENPEKIAAQQEFAREAARQAEVQVLAERVRQLEREADASRRSMPMMAPPPYPMSPPPVVQYAPEPAQAPVQYAQAPVQYAAPTPYVNPWCDPMWISCNNWLGPPLYSVP